MMIRRHRVKLLKTIIFILILGLINQLLSYHVDQLHDTLNIFSNKSDQELYLKYIKQKVKEPVLANDGSDSFKVNLKRQRNHASNSRTFYTIYEATKWWGQNRFCQMKLKPNTIELFQTDRKFNEIYKSVQPSKTNRTKNVYTVLNGCKYQNCFFTCDDRYLKYADALLFNTFDLNGDYGSAPEKYENLTSIRNPDQVWIVSDSGGLSTFDESLDKLMFNWTQSHYQNADLAYCAHGCLVAKETVGTYEEFITELQDEFKTRTNQTFWLLNQCSSQIRIEYVIEFTRHYNFTVLGTCGDLIRSLNATHLVYDSTDCAEACEDELLLWPKFYFSLEPKNCTDSVTGQFWRSLSNGLIPIVVQPSRYVYQRIAPQNSYIHAEDFNFNFADLAQYLRNVSSNFDLYVKHHKWRYDSEAVYRTEDIDRYRYCELCAKLNTETDAIYYESTSKWFNSKCRS